MRLEEASETLIFFKGDDNAGQPFVKRQAKIFQKKKENFVTDLCNNLSYTLLLGKSRQNRVFEEPKLLKVGQN